MCLRSTREPQKVLMKGRGFYVCKYPRASLQEPSILLIRVSPFLWLCCCPSTKEDELCWVIALQVCRKHSSSHKARCGGGEGRGGGRRGLLILQQDLTSAKKAVLKDMGPAHTPCNLKHGKKQETLEMHGNPSSSAQPHCKTNTSVLTVGSIGFAASNQSSNWFNLLSSFLQSPVPNVSYPVLGQAISYPPNQGLPYIHSFPSPLL